MQHFHNNLLNLFFAFREFIFLKFSEMHNMNVLDYLSYAERELYETYSSDINYIAENCYKIEGLSKVFREIQQNHLCDEIGGNKLYNNSICNYYMEVISSLGFYNFVSFWVEELRNKKHYALSIDKKNNINNFILKDDERTIKLFNNLQIHPDINFMFIHFILPYINEERKITIDKIKDYINSEFHIYVIFIIIYFLLIIAIYILFWKIILNSIKSLIYKTIKMLAIIPVQILETQTNIKNLLGISDLNN